MMLLIYSHAISGSAECASWDSFLRLFRNYVFSFTIISLFHKSIKGGWWIFKKLTRGTITRYTQVQRCSTGSPKETYRLLESSCEGSFKIIFHFHFMTLLHSNFATLYVQIGFVFAEKFNSQGKIYEASKDRWLIHYAGAIWVRFGKSFWGRLTILILKVCWAM